MFRPWSPGVRDDQHAPVPAPGALGPNLLRAVTDEIMQAIAKLSGREYAGIGARQAKAALAHGDGPGGDLE